MQMGSEMKGSDEHGSEYTPMVSLGLQEESRSKGKGPVLKASEESTAISDLDSMRLPHTDLKLKDLEGQYLEKQENGESSLGEVRQEVDQHGTEVIEVIDASPHLQKKTSFIQRVARGVQGGDYHTLATPSSNEKPH
ncbi:hypothetical protein L7F22_065034 [Adiantum nelumboides]|nr:hypothetical protein [Adiantum nelumboides]